MNTISQKKAQCFPFFFIWLSNNAQCHLFGVFLYFQVLPFQIFKHVFPEMPFFHLSDMATQLHPIDSNDMANKIMVQLLTCAFKIKTLVKTGSYNSLKPQKKKVEEEQQTKKDKYARTWLSMHTVP